MNTPMNKHFQILKVKTEVFDREAGQPVEHLLKREMMTFNKMNYDTAC